MSKRVEQKPMKPYGRWQYVENGGMAYGNPVFYADELPRLYHDLVEAGEGRIARVRVVEEPEPKAKKARSKR